MADKTKDRDKAVKVRSREQVALSEGPPSKKDMSLARDDVDSGFKRTSEEVSKRSELPPTVLQTTDEVGEASTTAKRTLSRSTKVTDWQVRIKVIEARQLAGSHISPFCRVTVLKQSQATHVRRNTNAPFWNCYFVFNVRAAGRDLLDESLFFAIYNSKKFRFDSLLCSFKLDVGLVYESDQHALINKWLLLTEADNVNGGSRGYLKICASVLGPGDQVPMFQAPESSEEDTDLDSLVIRPSGMITQAATLFLRVYKAEDIPRMGQSEVFASDKKEHADPYVAVKFAGKSLKTKTVAKTYHPEFNQVLRFNFQYPSMCDRIRILLMDDNGFRKDAVNGVYNLSLSEISSSHRTCGFEPTFGPSFINFYGAPREFDVRGKHEHLNIGSELGEGAAYRGRLMIEVKTQINEKEMAQSIEPVADLASEEISMNVKQNKQRFRLFAAFHSVGLMQKCCEPVTFEVSIGDYGNILDETSDSSPSCSSTVPLNPISDGNHYYYVPFNNAYKPCCVVNARWEDTTYRIHFQNLLDNIARTCEVYLMHIGRELRKGKAVANDPTTKGGYVPEDIAVLLTKALEFVRESTLETDWLPEVEVTHVPENELDRCIRKIRLTELRTIGKMAQDTLTMQLDDVDAIIHSAMQRLEAIVQSLRTLMHEPQRSIPDVLIWMLVNRKRVAYYRVPVNQIYYSSDNWYVGRHCGRTMTLYLHDVEARKKSRSRLSPAQLRVKLWFGRYEDQHSWLTVHPGGKPHVYAELWECETASGNRFCGKDVKLCDSSGRIELTTDFRPPPNWQFMGDWKPRPVITSPVSFSTEYLQHAFAVEEKDENEQWTRKPTLFDEDGNPFDERCPEGWKYTTQAWTVVYERLCDKDGYEYSVDGSPGTWMSVCKYQHCIRRRKIVRPRVRDAVSSVTTESAEGWEYASGGTFGDIRYWRAEAKTGDSIRRRCLIRQLEVGNSIEAASELSQSQLTTSAEELLDHEASDNLKQAKVVRSVKKEKMAIVDRSSKKKFSSERMLTTDAKKRTNLMSLLRQKKHKAATDDARPVTLGKSETELPVPMRGKRRQRAKDNRPTYSEKREDAHPFQSCMAVTPKGLVAVPPRMEIHYEEVHRYQLRAYIYQARNLRGDRTDPYMHVCILNMSKTTRIIQQAVAPKWDQMLLFDEFVLPSKFSNNDQLESLPDVVMELFDQNRVGGDELLGRVIAKPFLHDSRDRETLLEWWPAYRGEKLSGEVLAAFELFYISPESPLPPYPAEKKLKHKSYYPIPEDVRPKTEYTRIEILCWGVRNLASYMLTDVTSPSVEFEIEGVKVSSQTIKNVRKTPNFANPLLILDINLPKLATYMPPLRAIVKDHRQFGHTVTVGRLLISDLASKRYSVPTKSSSNAGTERDPLAKLFTGECIGSTEVLPPAYEDVFSSVRPGDAVIDMPINTTGNHPFRLLPSWSSQISETALRKSSGRSSQPSSNQSEVGLIRSDDLIDWWCKYFAGMGEMHKCQAYLESIYKYEHCTIYMHELEKDSSFGNSDGFQDFCRTYYFTRGKSTDVEQEHVGELKVDFKVHAITGGRRLDEKDIKLYYDEDKLKDLKTDPIECLVRVYIICGFDLQPADANGLVDPYIEIKIGKQEVNNRSDHTSRTTSPLFGKMFELKCQIPLEKDLLIRVRDRLQFFDDTIGETKIDLENRLMSKFRATCGLPKNYYVSGPFKWRDNQTPSSILERFCRQNSISLPVYEGNAENVRVRIGARVIRLRDFERLTDVIGPESGEPKERLALHVLNNLPLVQEHVETRSLYNESQCGLEQGKIQLWVDIFPLAYGPPGPPINITPRRPQKFELRLVIWNTYEVALKDVNMYGEQMSDIYVKAQLVDSDKEQETDVHYRSMNGEANFNWRFVFPFEYMLAERLLCVRRKRLFWLDDSLELVPLRMRLELWDNDVFSRDQRIGELMLNLCEMPLPAKTIEECDLDQLPDVDFDRQAVRTLDLFSLESGVRGIWPVYDDQDGQRIMTGKVEMELKLVCGTYADSHPVGRGRAEPNVDPHLEFPKRPQESFLWLHAPMKAFRWMILRRYKWQIISFFVIAGLTAFLLLFLYAVPSATVNKLFGV